MLYPIKLPFKYEDTIKIYSGIEDLKDCHAMPRVGNNFD